MFPKATYPSLNKLCLRNQHCSFIYLLRFSRVWSRFTVVWDTQELEGTCLARCSLPSIVLLGSKSTMLTCQQNVPLKSELPPAWGLSEIPLTQKSFGAGYGSSAEFAGKLCVYNHSRNRLMSKGYVQMIKLSQTVLKYAWPNSNGQTTAICSLGLTSGCAQFLLWIV